MEYWQTGKPGSGGADQLLDQLAGRLPWSDEAETGLLSCVLQDPEGRLHEVRKKVPEEAYYNGSNRTIWRKLVELSDANKPLDPVLLTQALRDSGELEGVGGPAAISELFTFAPIPAHYVHYTQIVLDKWAMRRLMEVTAGIMAETIGQGAEEGAEPGGAVELVTRAESKVFGLVEEIQRLGESGDGAVKAETGIIEWLDHMSATIDNRGKITGLTTGIHEIDLTLHGIDDKEGEIFVIAGRPGMGKTAMACTVANHLAIERGIPGLIFSIEMSANQLYTRMVLGGAEIDTSKGISGHFSDPEKEQMSKQAMKMQKAPLWVCGSAAVNTADIRAQVQLLRRRFGIRWIMVDHLHLVKASNPKVQGDERMRLVEVMETLQYLKKEHHLGVFLLVQMARESDRAAGKEPVLADLAGSAAIEQYADHVMFIHRECKFVPWHKVGEDQQKAWMELIEPRRQRSPQLWSDGMKYDEEAGGFARQDYEEKAVLFFRKNRRGPTPDVQVRYQGEFTRFATRMPSVQSNNPLDHQMGSYAAARVQKAKQAKEAKPMGGGRVEKFKRGGHGGGSGMDEVFPE